MAFPTSVSSPSRRTASALRRPEFALAGALALAFGTAAALAERGGDGRVGEIALVGAVVLLGYLGGIEVAIAAGAAGAAIFLALDALSGRLDGSRSWPGVVYAAAIVVAALLSGSARAAPRARANVPTRVDPFGRRPRPGSLGYELQRALRHERSVSLVLIRARVGGPTRRVDARLAEIAGAIGAQIRATDLAIRRSAHDFWLVLPETADGSARILGERLRLALGTADASFAIGIATFPHDGLSAAGLVSAAERALARAVELGGNRTVLCSVPRDAPPGWGLAQAS
jgi:hypothetical protein